MRFQQHYPTYTFKHRDVVLLEFTQAQEIATMQSKLYGQLANILLGFTTIGLTLLIKSYEESWEIVAVLPEYAWLFVVIVALIGLVILRYFVELQRSIVLNARKVVTLRSILGLNYGSLQLTIPNWRVEGAVNPSSHKINRSKITCK